MSAIEGCLHLMFGNGEAGLSVALVFGTPLEEAVAIFLAEEPKTAYNSSISLAQLKEFDAVLRGEGFVPGQYLAEACYMHQSPSGGERIVYVVTAHGETQAASFIRATDQEDAVVQHKALFVGTGDVVTILDADTAAPIIELMQQVLMGVANPADVDIPVYGDRQELIALL